MAAARARGSWLALDAAATLCRFTSGGTPDAAGFDREVGGLIRQAARDGRAVRAFGEMVALLWDAGLVTAAVELEAMWNDLGPSASLRVVLRLSCSLGDRGGCRWGAGRGMPFARGGHHRRASDAGQRETPPGGS